MNEAIDFMRIRSYRRRRRRRRHNNSNNSMAFPFRDICGSLCAYSFGLSTSTNWIRRLFIINIQGEFDSSLYPLSLPLNAQCVQSDTRGSREQGTGQQKRISIKSIYERQRIHNIRRDMNVRTIARVFQTHRLPISFYCARSVCVLLTYGLVVNGIMHSTHIKHIAFFDSYPIACLFVSGCVFNRFVPIKAKIAPLFQPLRINFLKVMRFWIRVQLQNYMRSGMEKDEEDNGMT